MKLSFVGHVSKMVGNDVDTILKKVFNRRKVHNFQYGELDRKSKCISGQIVSAVSNHSGRDEVIVSISTGSMSKTVKIGGLLKTCSEVKNQADKLNATPEETNKLVKSGLRQRATDGTKKRLNSGNG